MFSLLFFFFNIFIFYINSSLTSSSLSYSWNFLRSFCSKNKQKSYNTSFFFFLFKTNFHSVIHFYIFIFSWVCQRNDSTHQIIDVLMSSTQQSEEWTRIDSGERERERRKWEKGIPSESHPQLPDFKSLEMSKAEAVTLWNGINDCAQPNSTGSLQNVISTQVHTSN